MIPVVHEMGKRTIGLLYHLYGPVTHEEYIAPHLVAARDSLASDPGRRPGGPPTHPGPARHGLPKSRRHPIE
ncbi:hypothetical protein [Streptomyces sp. YIM S03343]